MAPNPVPSLAALRPGGVPGLRPSVCRPVSTAQPGSWVRPPLPSCFTGRGACPLGSALPLTPRPGPCAFAVLPSPGSLPQAPVSPHPPLASHLAQSGAQSTCCGSTWTGRFVSWLREAGLRRPPPRKCFSRAPLPGCLGTFGCGPHLRGHPTPACSPSQCSLPS